MKIHQNYNLDSPLFFLNILVSETIMNYGNQGQQVEGVAVDKRLKNLWAVDW